MSDTTIIPTDLTPGCYVDGHWGQYGVDHLADQFGTDQTKENMSNLRGWAEWFSSNDRYDESAEFWQARIELADRIESDLNAVLPDGLVAHWHDGEFFISPICDDDPADCDDETCACHC